MVPKQPVELALVRSDAEIAAYVAKALRREIPHGIWRRRRVSELRFVTLGRRPPRAAPKNLEVYALVERASIAAGGRRPKWRDLMEKWNANVRPQNRYHDVGSFSRDYRRAKRVIVRDLVAAEAGGLGRFEERSRIDRVAQGDD